MQTQERVQPINSSSNNEHPQKYEQEQLIPNSSGAVKRIVKVPLPEILRKKIKTDNSDGWKPKTLEECRAEQISNSNNAPGKASLITKNFMLSKPKNTSDDMLKPRASNFKKPPPKAMIDLKKPTEQQLKWDIEDQSFIVKDLERATPNPNLREKFEEEESIIRQDELPEDFKGRKITVLNKQSLIDSNWQQKEKERKLRLTLWQGAADTVASVTGVNREKNQINALLEDAMKRAEQIDFEMGKRSGERMMMKKRYGW